MPYMKAKEGAMSAFASRWSNVGLQLKLQILIQSFLMIILVGTQLWLAISPKD